MKKGLQTKEVEEKERGASVKAGKKKENGRRGRL